MRAIRYIVVGVLTVGLLVTSVGWYRVASAGSDQHFDSCRFDGPALVLSYSYGANQRVSPTVDSRGGDVVVALHVEVGKGSTRPIWRGAVCDLWRANERALPRRREVELLVEQRNSVAPPISQGQNRTSHQLMSGPLMPRLLPDLRTMGLG